MSYRIIVYMELIAEPPTTIATGQLNRGGAGQIIEEEPNEMFLRCIVKADNHGRLDAIRNATNQLAAQYGVKVHLLAAFFKTVNHSTNFFLTLSFVVNNNDFWCGRCNTKRP